MHPHADRYPIAVLSAAVVLSIAFLLGANARWAHIAVYTIAGSVLGGLGASFLAGIDWRSRWMWVRCHRVELQTIGEALLLVVFAITWWLR